MGVDFYQRMIVLVALLAISTASADEPVATTTAVPTQNAVQLESIPLETVVDVATNQSRKKIDWVTSYNEARTLGTESDLPVMLFVTMRQCKYCQKLSDESFKTHEEELRKSFVPTKLYLDPESNLGKNLEITIFPTTMFIAPDGKILGYIRGYVPRERFSAELQAAKTANDELVRLARAKKDDSELE